ncbi:hypothetical protein TVNIR_1682 [Thioalkalivibrio nitratireducens DSM 14787]|uniref:Uncharacterized protein n=1 Tax=Thioalkalivibrio nitratireducens (strain DSM 14787 / UNIQEM 213 / ALEN2) TaxID=1255043 RepID=L0DY99_THIND|nr:hypothetical protein [Thioalkalivibrio nitratireducens]AGA33346.1 hypothetical protein TVNIR_1682 [Thioalkalivibrio nitratireducens DSM 14787]
MIQPTASNRSGNALAIAFALLAVPAVALSAETIVQWEGWLVGAPCAQTLTVQDCPLRHVDASVRLLENGEALALSYGEGTAIRDVDVDQAYGKRVRVSGQLR